MKNVSLDSRDIELILVALDLSKKELIKIYNEQWTEKRFVEIRNKLEQVETAIEDENIKNS